MKRIKVLVVDDAVVVRRMLSDVLASDPEIEVVGTAANGRIAVQKLTQVNPDVVTLDIEMPEMDGLATLRAMRVTHPKLPIIMFSTLTALGAAATLDALSAGASDYVTKPANVGSVSIAQQRIRDELIPKVHALCGLPTSITPPVVAPPLGALKPPASRPPMRPAVVTAADPSVRPRPQVVAIGVSTGGPNALAAVLPKLPPDFAVPIVLVQHMPPMFTKFLADRLNQQSALTVVEAQGGETLRPGHAYIAPGNFHMTVVRKNGAVVTALNQDPPENSCRPAVDVLFRSVASVYGGRALGVVMTGMGQDGLRGCELLRAANAQIVVQDERTSVVWGMPGFVANAGLADRIAPLELIADELTLRTSAGALSRC